MNPLQSFLRIAVPAVVVWTCGLCVGAENADKPDAPRQIEIFTFAELLKKAEYIVVADVGAASEGVSTLAVHQILKAPKKDPKQVDPEVLKRAAALLADDKLQLPPAKPKPPAPIKVIAEKSAKLPPQGTQAVFFLWDQAAAGDGELVFRLAHPQCIYDFEFLAQIQAAVERPRSLASGRYLREWDRQMAERVREREVDEAMLKAKGGEVVMGLRIKAARPVLSVRGDNSFGVLAVIENTRARQQTVYDGPASNYGVVLRPQDGDASKGIILHQSVKRLAAGTDKTVLGMPDLTDFALVPGDGGLSKELFFDSKEFPVLKELQGNYVLSVFYTSTQDGKDAELEMVAWTGALISEGVPLQITSKTQKPEK